jgi:hypothetical protein
MERLQVRLLGADISGTLVAFHLQHPQVGDQEIDDRVLRNSLERLYCSRLRSM